MHVGTAATLPGDIALLKSFNAATQRSGLSAKLPTLCDGSVECRRATVARVAGLISGDHNTLNVATRR